MFKLKSDFKPIPDQKRTIAELEGNFRNGKNYQVLLGVTGSGKTFTIANLIERLNLPTLMISHNKTLAGQLYQEMRDFFPDNSVNYFVSYYDYYQPESYIPNTDTYIEKDSSINEQIDKLRLATTSNLMTRDDVVVVASVSSIYNIGSPTDYNRFVLRLAKEMEITREAIIENLIEMQYTRNDFAFTRGSFRLRGNNIDIFLPYDNIGIRVILEDGKIKVLEKIDVVSGETQKETINDFFIFPAKHFMADTSQVDTIFKEIEADTQKQILKFKKEGKLIEAQRIKQRVTYDLQMIKEVGYVKGIENYSRYFDGRGAGDAPFSLVDYFNYRYDDNWLLVVDESHMSFPQIRGMYAGDHSRKQTLIDYGFRLPSALDNRPLTFPEFLAKIKNFIAVSATPDEWEIDYSDNTIVEQLVRPTGIVEPEIDIRPSANQVADILAEAKKITATGGRILITTLTKQMAEDLSQYLKEQGLKVHYLHSTIKTLERSDILDKLRLGEFDVLVGINLLREGLDLPEVSLVAILDADKEGFLRSKVSLIQTMGRSARNKDGRVILYADTKTGSINQAILEIERRRQIQLEYNQKHNVKITSISKPLRSKLFTADPITVDGLDDDDFTSQTPMEKKRNLGGLKREMKRAAQDLDFELAIRLRDKIREIEKI